MDTWLVGHGGIGLNEGCSRKKISSMGCSPMTWFDSPANSKENTQSNNEPNFRHIHNVFSLFTDASRTKEETPIVPAQNLNLSYFSIVTDLRRDRLHGRQEKFRHLITESHLHVGFIPRIRTESAHRVRTSVLTERFFTTRPWIASHFLPTHDDERQGEELSDCRKKES